MSSPTSMEKLDPATTALVVLDVQPVIMSMIKGSDSRLDTIVETINVCQKKNCCLTVYVRVAFTHEEWASISPNVKNFHEMKMQMGNTESAPDFIHLENNATALHPRVQEQVNKGDHLIIRKNRYGPFASTDLLQQLKDRNIQTLIIVGFKTSGAILSTVRFAADHDFKVIVLRDTVLDPDAELEQAILNKIIPEQGHVISLDDLQRAF